jgi:hypothetical protein
LAESRHHISPVVVNILPGDDHGWHGPRRD